MIYVGIFVLSVLVIEFLIMLMSYDDYFDNLGWSITWGVVLTIIIMAIAEAPEGMCKKKGKPTMSQTAQLDDQWGADIVDDVLDIEKLEQQEVGELDRKVDRLVDLIESIPSRTVAGSKPERPTPSTSSYVDGSRRDYGVKVTYDYETREACDGVGDCFKAQTIQHTDGTFWACKRNYGTCYQY